MYNLQKMTLINIVTYKKVTIDFRPDGSYYIEGENLDNKSMGSNASGKSLIPDAISWGLFGKTVRGLSHKEDIVGPHGSYSYLHQKWFDDELKRIIDIKRYHNHKEHKNRVYVSIDKKDVTKETPSETDEFIEKLFKMDYHLFIYGVMITKPRGEKSFCESTDTGRKDVLTQVLNLNWINDTLKKVKKDNDELKKEIKEKESKIDIHKDKISFFKTNLEESKKEFEKFEWERQNQIDMSTQVQDIVKVVTKKNILKIENKIELYQRQWKICKAKIDQVRKLEMEQFSLENTDRVIRLNEFQKKTKLLISKLDQIKNGNILKEDLCLHCGAKYNINNKHGLIEHYKKEIYDIQNQTVNIETKIAIDNNKIKLIKKNIEKIKPFKTLNHYENLIEAYRAKLSEAKVLRERFLAEKKILNERQKYIESWKKKINPWKLKQNEYKKEISKLGTLISSIEIENKKCITKLHDLEFWIEGFGNSGIKNDIISEKLDMLEERINHYLSKITEGDITIKLDNKKMHGSIERIGMLIYDGFKKKPMEFRVWSGGEANRIDFCTEYSINSLLDSPVNLVIIDEGFDKLSITGIKKMIDVLQSEKQKKVICISNRTDINVLFENRLKVIRKNNESKVENVSGPSNAI